MSHFLIFIDLEDLKKKKSAVYIRERFDYVVF